MISGSVVDAGAVHGLALLLTFLFAYHAVLGRGVGMRAAPGLDLQGMAHLLDLLVRRQPAGCVS